VVEVARTAAAALASNAEATPSPSGSHAPGSPSSEFVRLIGHEFARRHLILSTGVLNEKEQLLVAPSTRPAPIFNVGVRLGRPIETKVTDAETLAAAIDDAFSRAQSESAATSAKDALAGGPPMVTVEGSANVEADLNAAVRETERDLLSTSGKSPAVRLVDLVLFEALLRAASDVHIQPVRDRTLVRYRLDGALHTVRELPGSIAAAVVSRIKVMSGLDVAEQRAPQDGRATVTIGGAGGAKSQAGRRIDLRVSTLPNSYGERVVIRLLDPSRSPHLLSFGALGMPQAVERAYLEQVTRTSGIVLSTGPTGSGKTTTLYTTLAWINSSNAGAQSRGCELNIMTVEDPVEYDLSTSGLSISQTQVNSKKNVTFATGLRHILRQDPDVIMVGEVRDEETARMAVQASLTGHLVLSTLHTNDAASAVARLLDLSVEPFLVSSSLAAVLAQRLVRKVHPACRGEGCAECMQTGYKGRQGVFELLVLDGPIREMVGKRCSAVEIKDAAQRGGMVTLRDAGLHLVRAGVTTKEEVARVIENVEEELL
jgi:general secretion pathway protein E